MTPRNAPPGADELDGLPAYLRSADIQRLLQLSHGATYDLIRRECLALDLGPRVVRVPKERLRRWLASR